MTEEEAADDAQLLEYQTRLAAIPYDGEGAVAALVITPEMDRHDFVNSLRILPGSGVEGQYPGKQWWRGKLVPGTSKPTLSFSRSTKERHHGHVPFAFPLQPLPQSARG